jgi:hypothetical protein
MDRMENNSSNNSSIVSCIFVAAVTFLPSNGKGILIQTHGLMGGIYEVRR